MIFNCCRRVLLIFDLTIPRQFVSIDHPDRQKFRIDYVISYLCIFKKLRGHREDGYLLLLHLVQEGLFCTTVLHLALISASVVVTVILLYWCHAHIVLHLVPYPYDSVTNDNRPRKIVSNLVPDQAIVPHLVLDQIIVL